MWAGTSETESAFPRYVRENVRPPSWLSSAIGTKADAKHLGFCAFGAIDAPALEDSKARGCEFECLGSSEVRSFCFAYI